MNLKKDPIRKLVDLGFVVERIDTKYGPEETEAYWYKINYGTVEVHNNGVVSMESPFTFDTEELEAIYLLAKEMVEIYKESEENR